jgi:Domain of unknown function (DUF4062)
MARPKTIRVMISSRCTDKILLDGEEVDLSAVRLRIKEELEQASFLGSQLLEVWINEDAPSEEGSLDSWDACLKQVDECDILLVLFNGNAGWAASDANVGICHAELERAISRAPAKVRLIEIEDKTKDTANRHKRFQEYIERLSRFRGATAKTGEQVIDRAKQAAREAVADLARMGVREAKKGKYHFGEALDWSRLDFSSRKAAIEDIVCESLGSKGKDRTLVRKVARTNIFFQVHAIPDAFSTPEARDLVGLPFLKDHELVEDMESHDGNAFGPVHIIAVHKTVGETQARKLLGHPDIVLVNAPFGYYLADRAQHVQVLLVANCRDATSTRYAMQRCFEWTEQSGEDDNIAERAKKRKRLIELIAKQIEKT